MRSRIAKERELFYVEQPAAPDENIAICFLCAVLVVFSLLICGCADSVGPNSVTQDRFHYADAISDSWKHEMLLNMVKIRYADSPVFLEVGSIISQYLMETEVNGALSWNTFLATDSQTVGVRGKYAVRPTVTYQPLTGEKFTRGIMTPISPSAILSLIQSGWRVDLVLRVCVSSVNGIHNRAGARMPAQNADPDFYRLTTSLRKIQQSRAIGLRVQETESKKKAVAMVFQKKDIDPETQAEIALVKELLGLDPESHEFKVVHGAVAANDQEIALLSRSMLEIFQELGTYIEVPEIHAAEKRVPGNFTREADIDAGIVPLMRIQSSKDEQSDAFITAHYRDHLFWIDDRDYQSKKLFSFMMFLLTLAETGTPPQAPVLTIPTG